MFSNGGKTELKYYPNLGFHGRIYILSFLKIGQSILMLLIEI